MNKNFIHNQIFIDSLAFLSSFYSKEGTLFVITISCVSQLKSNLTYKQGTRIPSITTT